MHPGKELKIFLSWGFFLQYLLVGPILAIYKNIKYLLTMLLFVLVLRRYKKENL